MQTGKFLAGIIIAFFIAVGVYLNQQKFLVVRGNIKGVIIGLAVALAAIGLPFALRPFFRKIGKGEAAAGKHHKLEEGKNP